MSDADRKAQLEEFMSQADQRANSTIKKVGGAILAHTPYLKNGHNKRATERSDARAQAMNEWDALDNKELIQQQFQEQVTNSEAEIEKAKNEKKGLEKDKKRLEALKAKENDATEKQKIEDQIKDINDKIDKQQEIIDKKAGIAAGKIDYKIGAVTLRLDLNEYIEIKKLMDDMEKIAQSGDPLLRSKLGGGFSDTLSAKGVVYMHKYEELYSKISVSGGATLMADPTVT